MKSFKNSVIAALAVSAFTLSGAHAASWQDSLNSAASQLSGSNAQASGGMSVSSLTSLLNGSSQSLTASSMNNAAGILSYCAQQKLASVTSADNVKKVLDKLGLSTPEKQKQDTSYLDGLQGLLNSKNGQQLDLNTLGNSSLAKQVKTKACDLVLKQGVNFLS